MRRNKHDIVTAVRDFLFNTFNKEFLIFLFFLMLSSAYWLMSVLNDTMEREIEIPVQLVNVPKNVIVIGDSAINLKVVVRDKGYAIATYMYGDRIKPVNISFTSYSRSDKVFVTNLELQKIVRDQLYGSTKLVAIKPDHLDVPYNLGLRKLVPVKLLGNIDTSGNYYLARVEFSPESVYVYASNHLLDSITAVYTSRQNIQEVADTVTRTIPLKRIDGVKFVPSSVKMTLYTDIMTEVTTTIPVSAINVPDGYVLRTFPSQIQVKYVIGASEYKKIDEHDFKVVADYSTTEDGSTPKCQLRLLKFPRTAHNPVLESSEVDYLIEQ